MYAMLRESQSVIGITHDYDVLYIKFENLGKDSGRDSLHVT